MKNSFEFSVWRFYAAEAKNPLSYQVYQRRGIYLLYGEKPLNLCTSHVLWVFLLIGEKGTIVDVIFQVK